MSVLRLLTSNASARGGWALASGLGGLRPFSSSAASDVAKTVDELAREAAKCPKTQVCRDTLHANYHFLLSAGLSQREVHTVLTKQPHLLATPLNAEPGRKTGNRQQ